MQRKTCYFYEVPQGKVFFYGNDEYVKTDKLSRNAFRVSDGLPKYFYVNTEVEIEE